MIYDHISNIERYRSLNKTLYEALCFLAKADRNLAAGKHMLSEQSWVNVQDYQSLRVNPVGYEAHRKFIDIQYAITGEERVAIRRLDTLEVTNPYDAQRDVAFCADDHKPYTDVTIGKGYFLVLYPNDAHMPQLCVDEPMDVKKAIAKISVEAL